MTTRIPSRGGVWIAVVVHTLAVQAMTFQLRPTIAYAALDSGLGLEWLGALSAAFALPGLALAIPLGHFIDRLGARVVAVAGGGMLVCCSLVVALFAEHIGMLFVASALLGVGHLASILAEQAALADRTRPEQRDSAFGLYAFVMALGQTAGAAALVINARDQVSPDLGVQSAIAVGLAVAVAISSGSLGVRRSRVTAPQEAVPSIRSLARDRGLVRIILTSSVVLSALEISMIYFPALGHERGFTVGVVSLMLASRSIAAMVSRIGLGFLSRSIGRTRFFVASALISAAALALLAIPGLDVAAIIVLCAIFGLANGVAHPLTLAWLSERAPAGRRGTVMSARMASVRVSQSLVPLAAGAVAAATGSGGALVATGIFVACAAVASRESAERSRADRRADPD